MNLHGIILAAGLGSRLRPLTDCKPKCLLEVDKKTLLEHQLRALRNAGLQLITIVTGHFHDQVEAFVRSNFPGDSIRICRNNFYQTTNNAYSLGLALKKEGGPFLLLDGDLLFENQLLKRLVESKKENLFVVDRQLDALTDEAMKVSFNNAGQIICFSKKINPAKAAGEYIGIARLGNKWFERLYNAVESMDAKARENAYYEDIINPLIPSSPPLNILCTGGHRWTEIDTCKDLTAAQADWSDNSFR